jgi:hypothetical protein
VGEGDGLTNIDGSKRGGGSKSEPIAMVEAERRARHWRSLTSGPVRIYFASVCKIGLLSWFTPPKVLDSV